MNKRTKNMEKARVKILWQNNQAYVKRLPRDSIEYFQRVMNQADATDVMYTVPPKYEDLISRDSTGQILVRFPDHLYIAFPGKKPSPAYSNVSRDPSDVIASMIILDSPEEGLKVFADGSYYNPSNLISEGYWAWAEKLGWMLPLNYTINERSD